MKFIVNLFILFIQFYAILAQLGSLNLEAKPNDQSQLSAKTIFSQNSNSHMLKNLYSIVNTPKFIIENKNPPEYPDNIKYTETVSSAIYIIELPHFPKFITKDDLQIIVGVAGARITAKDSGLYHNDAFFPDLTEETLSHIVRGKDYELDVRFFNKIKNNTESKVKIEINEKENNSYEIILTIDKSNFEPQPYLNKVNRLFVKNLNTISTSSKKIQELKEKIKAPFNRYERVNPETGLKMEIFKKNEDPAQEEVHDLEQTIKDYMKDETILTNPAKTQDDIKKQYGPDSSYTESNAEQKATETSEKEKKKNEKEIKESEKKNKELEKNMEEQQKKKEEIKENELEYEYE